MNMEFYLPNYTICRSCKDKKNNLFAWYCHSCAASRNKEVVRLGLLKRPLRSKAVGAVQNAIKRGDLMPPKSFKCADCNKQAECYDHRDYRKPLKVDAVCISCNSKRGAASPYKRIKNGGHNIPDSFGRKSKPLKVVNK